MHKSIIVDNDDMNICIICGAPRTDIHHVINGTANRKNSEKYGLIIPLCRRHHELIHKDQHLDLMMKKEAQRRFEKLYSHELYMNAFRKNYLGDEQ